MKDLENNETTTEKTDSMIVQEEPEHCPVCYEEIEEANRHKLSTCDHSLCVSCFANVARFSSLCPVCRKPFAVVRGNQPENARMRFIIEDQLQLPGFEGYGTILIHYKIPSGIQTEQHPKPGQPFFGTSRNAYLPNNVEGQKALRLLQKAFDARLIFTVGRSITTGMDDVVTWNDVHHKTRIEGGPVGYGYPDSTYIARLIEDLAAKGITE